MQNQSFDFKEICSSEPLGFIKPSSIMDFKDPVVKWIDENTTVVGYLSDDHNSSNPLEDMDGYGFIYTARDQTQEFNSVLGLDQYGSADTDLVSDHPLLRRRWVAAAIEAEEFQVYCQATAGCKEFSDDYYRGRAQRYWRENHDKYTYYSQSAIYDFEFSGRVLRELWSELRADRDKSIGDPDSVVLDCYEHGGCSWSLAGSGNQCRWDTSSGAGVWIPDSEARLEIDRRAKVYTFGFVDFTINEVGEKIWFALIEGQYQKGLKSKSPYFKQWSEAFAWLEQQGQTLKLSALGTKSEQQRYVRVVARRRAAMELAESALTLYNAWVNGDVYGTVVATLNRCNHGSWHVVDSESCWGYYGSEDSYSALRSDFDDVLADYRQRFAPEHCSHWTEPNTAQH